MSTPQDPRPLPERKKSPIELLDECEVRREDSRIDPWWQIIHALYADAIASLAAERDALVAANHEGYSNLLVARADLEDALAALDVMVRVFRPRDGEPGPDQQVECEAYDMARRARAAAAPPPGGAG